MKIPGIGIIIQILPPCNMREVGSLGMASLSDGGIMMIMEILKPLAHGNRMMAQFKELGPMILTILPSNMTTHQVQMSAKTLKVTSLTPISVVVISTSSLAGIPSVITWMVIQASLQEKCAVFAVEVQHTCESQLLIKLKENLATLDNKNVQRASFAEMLRTPLAIMCQCVPQKRQSQHQVDTVSVSLACMQKIVPMVSPVNTTMMKTAMISMLVPK